MGLVTGGGVIKKLDRPLVAAVDHVIEDTAVATLPRERFEQGKVRRQGYQSRRIARRAVAIRDRLVGWRLWINRKGHLSDEPFIRSDVTKRHALRKRLAHVNAYINLCLHTGVLSSAGAPVVTGA